MEKSNLINKNFIYFKNEILPYYIIVNTREGSIVIDTVKENLYHLLGINKSVNLKYKNMKPLQFYNYIEENIVTFEELMTDNTMTYLDDQYIYYKNKIFIPVFNDFLHNTNVMHHRKQQGDFFDSDYINFCWINYAGCYLGIIGGKQNKYYYFNSIMMEMENPEKYIGPKVFVTSISRVKKAEFNINNYKIISSKRYINIENKKTKSKTNTKPNYKIVYKKINKSLKNGLNLKYGASGKNTLQLYRNNISINKHFENELESCSLTKPNEIADYINKKYKNHR